MHDSYPGFLSYALWVIAGLLTLCAVLFLTPVGATTEKRGEAVLGALMLAALFVGGGFMAQRSHSADQLAEANRNVAKATVAYENAVRAEREIAAGNATGRPPTSTSEKMSFGACKDRVREMEGSGAGEIIMDSEDAKIVRFHATDGSVLVTCSKPDGKMVITRSARP